MKHQFNLPNNKKIFAEVVGTAFDNKFIPDRSFKFIILQHCSNIKEGDIIHSDKLSFKVVDCSYNKNTSICINFSLEVL